MSMFEKSLAKFFCFYSKKEKTIKLLGDDLLKNDLPDLYDHHLKIYLKDIHLSTKADCLVHEITFVERLLNELKAKSGIEKNKYYGLACRYHEFLLKKATPIKPTMPKAEIPKADMANKHVVASMVYFLCKVSVSKNNAESLIAPFGLKSAARFINYSKEVADPKYFDTNEIRKINKLIKDLTSVIEYLKSNHNNPKLTDTSQIKKAITTAQKALTDQKNKIK